MPEDRAPISSSRMSAADVARHTFASVRRGFEPQEVRAYLELVARELQGWEQRDEQLREQVAQAQDAARHPVIDEATLSTALGQQSAKVLRNAHDEAARIMGQAEEAAAHLLREAQQQATDLAVEAETAAAGRIADAELAASSLEQQAREQTESLRTQAVAEGEALLERAREQGRAVLTKVQEARRDVLADLTQRRKALLLQIEQFRAARDELATSVLGLRDTFDTIVADLGQADDRARLAATAAGDAHRAAARHAEAPVSVADVDVERLVPMEPDTGAITPPAGTPVTEPRVVVIGGDVPDPAYDGDPTASVDELFARIRASQVEEGPGPADGAGGPAGPGADGAPDGAEDGALDGAEDGAVDEDAALLELRSSVLDPIVVTLARRLKRSLQDEQNHVLDQLRSARGPIELPVPGEAQHRAYVETATPQLREAFAAGASFALELSGGEAAGEPDPAPVAVLADELAGEIVATLSRRLVGEESAGEDELERVSAAYREWRGERIERLVGDISLGAFSEGVLAGTVAGVGVRWLPAAHDGACADCDDNSMAEPVVPGAEFPTGHRHPPAHAGCRCLVAPAHP